MTLIYPREAWARFGPPPIIIHDARGRVLRNVVACDPLTGEVISNLLMRPWLAVLLTRLSPRLRTELILCRHWFAPAPLTITHDDSASRKAKALRDFMTAPFVQPFTHCTDDNA
jgi:hypothetical protein